MTIDNPALLGKWMLKWCIHVCVLRYDSALARLQRAQHAPVVTPQYSHSCSLTSTDLLSLRQLHWLRIEWRTKFKLASLTYKALHTGHPPYLAELLQYHKPARSTRFHAFICKSRTLSSTPQPFIWFSCFSYLSSQNMEFLTTSHSAVSNTLFI